MLAALVVAALVMALAPPTVAEAAPARTAAESSAEARLVDSHDQARRAAGRSSLRVAPDLREVARAWSDEMARTGSFRHNPNVAAQICCWTAWGENVAWAGPVDAIGGWRPTAERIMQGWLDSSGHRANILSGTYQEVGIGVAVAGNGRMYATAVFRRPDGTASPEAQPVPTARSIDAACPSGRVPSAGFVDVAAGQQRAVDCLAWWQVAEGIDGRHYAPSRTVTRAQMASFLARAIERSGGTLPSPGPQRFTDVDPSSAHGPAIQSLARAGVLGGYPDGSFRPHTAVDRAQVARLLVQGFEHRTGTAMPGPSTHWFTDVGGPNTRVINQAAHAGWATGDGAGSFGPHEDLQRGHLALFLTRWLDTLVGDHGAATPR
jgi:uncharacterized protein YkwD